MMDLSKHLEFFNPMDLKEEIHIIGVGATGSNIAIQLARLGINRLHIWDFDTVSAHNITNQVYDTEDISKEKTVVLKEKLLKINPRMKVYTHKKYIDQPLKNYVFLCLDSIEQRFEILKNNKFNRLIKLVIETRIGLSTGQVIVTDWSNTKEIDNHIKMCDFKDDESNVVTSACGTEMNIGPTVLVTTAYTVVSFINYIKGRQTEVSQIHFDAFNFKTTTY